MCRYICCGCGMRYTHRVLSFEEANIREESDRCPYIKIEINDPTATDGQFLCVKFRSIPVGLTSYPIKITINGSDVPVKTRSGRTVTTADLYENIMLSGLYSDEPVFTIC